MLSDKVQEFLAQNHQAVMTTFRRNGAAQMSIVTVGAFRDGVAFTTTAGRAKLPNLVRDPRCSLLVSKQDWWGYVVLEGRAQVLAADNTDAAELRQALRDVYRWDEYDAAMVKDRRAAVVVVPDHVYGTAV